MTAQAVQALRAEQARALELFASLTDEEWQRPSGCAGWRVQDVACHMASTFHSIADPGTIEAGSSHDVEENAEVPVQARRDWTPQQVIDEYREWSDKGIAALAMLQEPPMADMVIPLGNLGSHPMHILGNAITFDHYCHLRHDIGAAIERAAALPRDPDALAATVEWMVAGIPQMCADALAATPGQGVNLVFAGDCDAAWTLAPGADGWTVSAGTDPSLPTCTSTAHDFVSWGTKRADWRASARLDRDDSGAAATLDAVNVI
jgi:uncharacterized protein (TIGR03083 family)